MSSTVNNKLMTFSQMQGNQVFYNNNQNIVKPQSQASADNELKADTLVIGGKEVNKKKAIGLGAAVAVAAASLGALFGLASKGKNINKFVNGVSDENLKLRTNIQEGFKYTVSKVKSLWNGNEKLQCEDINNKIKAGKEKVGTASVKPAESDAVQSRSQEPAKPSGGGQQSSDNTPIGQQGSEKSENAPELKDAKDASEGAPKKKKMPKRTPEESQKSSVGEPEKETDKPVPKNKDRKKANGAEPKSEPGSGQKPENDGKTEIKSGDKAEPDVKKQPESKNEPGKQEQTEPEKKPEQHGKKEEIKTKQEQKPLTGYKTDFFGPDVINEIRATKEPHDRREVAYAAFERAGEHNKQLKAQLTEEQFKEYVDEQVRKMAISAKECSTKADDVINEVKKLFKKNGFNDMGEKIADISQISEKTTIMKGDFIVDGQDITRECKIQNGIVREIRECLPNGDRFRNISLDENGIKTSYCEGYTEIGKTVGTSSIISKTVAFDQKTGKLDTYLSNSLTGGASERVLEFKNGKPAVFEIPSGEGFGNNHTLKTMRYYLHD